MEEVIGAICEREFGQTPHEIREIKGGLMSKTFSVEFSDESYIIQVSAESEPHELENCVKSFEFLKDDVSVPQIVTDRVCKIEDKYYTVVKKLPGEAVDGISSQNITRKAGAELAKIHGCKSFNRAGWIDWQDSGPRVVGFPEGSLKSRVTQLMRKRLQFFEERGIDWMAEITQRFLDNYVGKVPEDFEPVFVHHDFNPGNILVEKDEITGILDFDYSHSSHSQRDLAKAANKFWLRGGNREELYKGYEEVRSIGESFEGNKSIYLLETLIDEIAAMIELEYKTAEDCEKYEEELLRLEENLEN